MKFVWLILMVVGIMTRCTRGPNSSTTTPNASLEPRMINIIVVKRVVTGAMSIPSARYDGYVAMSVSAECQGGGRRLIIGRTPQSARVIGGHLSIPWPNECLGDAVEITIFLEPNSLDCHSQACFGLLRRDEHEPLISCVIPCVAFESSATDAGTE